MQGKLTRRLLDSPRAIEAGEVWDAGDGACPGFYARVVEDGRVTHTAGDPTLVANGSVNAVSGRYEFTAVRSNLSAFSASTTALNGAFIMNAVPRSNANGLNVPAMFAVKPQFYENGTTTVAVTFTVTAP